MFFCVQFFFFKHKTAYEMLISDCSSDVCSSDLLEGDHFYVDLVFYNRLLRCFVLVDLKLGKLTHQDLGQMQMYVNHFDRFQRAEHEIGRASCRERVWQYV